nr:PREDICTED: uncharacterized protein LOC109035473 [Bemisia tabaci]
MLLHWNLNDLVEEVDGNFAMIILVGLVCTVMEVILLLFYFIETTSRGNVVIRNIIQDIVLLTRIVLLCKAGSDIVQQHNETLVQLERLNRKRAKLLNGSEQSLVCLFCARLRNRISTISCGGYIDINLRFITTIVGFVLMYWIVLIQLNDEHQKKQKS